MTELYACTECGETFEARPIVCKCGAKLAGKDGKGVVRVKSEVKNDGPGLGITFDIDEL